MSKYTQRTPHYVRHVGHGLTRPARGWAPVFLNGAGVQLARAEDGFWCTAVAVDFEDPDRIGLIYDGVIYTPATPDTPRVTLFVGATDGAVTSTQEAPYQAIAEVVDAHHTAIAIHAPVASLDSAYVQRGTTADKLALGVVANHTPFYDDTLGRLERFDFPVPSDVFVVSRDATNTPGVGRWTATTHMSGLRFRVALSPTDTANNATVDLPDGVPVDLWLIGNLVQGTGAVSPWILGWQITVTNNAGVLSVVNNPGERRFRADAGNSYLTFSYNALDLSDANTGATTAADVARIFQPGPPVGVWNPAADATGAATTFATAAEALAGAEASKAIAPDVLAAELDRRELALDFDQYLGARTVATWDDATLPVAQANHFYRFADSGTVAALLGAANVPVQRGDVVRARVDGTVAATVADWDLVPVSPADSDVGPIGATLPAASDFSLFVLTATDGAFSPGVYMSDGVSRHQVFATP